MSYVHPATHFVMCYYFFCQRRDRDKLLTKGHYDNCMSASCMAQCVDGGGLVRFEIVPNIASFRNTCTFSCMILSE